MFKVHDFESKPSLKYLGLASDYTPFPKNDPIAFLKKHITQLPPHLLAHYSAITTPKQRTVIPVIRNRRLQYTRTAPTELNFVQARNSWPHLWEGKLQTGVEGREDENIWAEEEFMSGKPTHVGKLAGLLAGFEEERENERVRALRRMKAADEFVPEEDSDSDSADEEEAESCVPVLETDVEKQASFEHRIQERFVYGLLDDIDYDKVDWDESLDEDDDREVQDRWFDED